MNEREYRAQVMRMSRIARRWVKENPDKTVQIVWARSIDLLVGLVGDAIVAGFVTVNDNGMELFRAMGCFSKSRKEPTVTMVRLALDGLRK